MESKTRAGQVEGLSRDLPVSQPPEVGDDSRIGSDARRAGVLAASVVALGQGLNAAAAYAATLAIREADP
jgi:hypothetical protein